MQENIKAYMLLAFELGRWRGQVDLEESMDRGQYAQCLIEAINARKTTMPNDIASTGKTIRYNLRSEKWKEGVKKTCKNELKKILINLENVIQKE